MYFTNCFTVLFGLTTAELIATNPSLRSVAKLDPLLANLKASAGKLDLKVPDAQRRILNDLPWGIRFSLLKNISKQGEKTVKQDEQETRKVDIQALVLPDEKAPTNEEKEAEDVNMKMKLFRLMYETVRDSDLKVKKAELIKNSYTNDTAFEIGYLLSDITDKYNIMNDITDTLKRLYHEWKPIEHINAYEQLANLAIDMGHIIDMVKGAEKKENHDKSKPAVYPDYLRIL